MRESSSELLELEWVEPPQVVAPIWPRALVRDVPAQVPAAPVAGGRLQAPVAMVPQKPDKQSSSVSAPHEISSTPPSETAPIKPL